jgi:hypothetical protein
MAINTTKPNKNYQNNRQTYNLRGKVKSVIEFNYKQYVPDTELSDHVTKRYYKFDAAGNCTELTTFLLQESFQGRNVYQYDEAGNYTHLIAYNEDSTVDYKATWKFDEEGNMIDFLNYNRYGDLKYRHQNTYGPNHSFVTILYGVTPPGSTSTYRYTYDAAGRRTSEDYYYHGDTTPRRRTVWMYSGDTTKETEYNRWGDLESTRLSIYDKNNRLIASKVDNDYNDMKETFHKYDAFGNVLEWTVRNSTGIDMKHSCRYKYKYDKAGNWISRITYKADGSLRSSIERKIVYY